jgi:Ribbon-helix-helix protein, copG family
LPVLLRQNPVVQNHDDAGVDLLPQKKYFCLMETVTLKMDRKHITLLKEQAKALGRSQAAVVRDLIDQHLTSKKRPSLHERAKEFCGSVSGPADMSTRKLTGYGRD